MTPALLLAVALAAAPEEPSLAALLERAAGHLELYREKLALVRATERSRQSATLRGRAASDRMQTKRVLVSDVLWVPSEELVLLAFYRDVYSVDGKPVRDRTDRLARLFPEGETAKARAGAKEIIDESARFNLGLGHWNANFPTFPLAFLHARNRHRFDFRRGGRSKLQGRMVVELEFREIVHPTVTRSSDGKEHFAARGTLFVAPDDGAVLKTDLRFEEVPARFVVTYRNEPKVGIFVPDEMRISYGTARTSEQIEGVSSYTDYRSGAAEIGPIRFK